MPTYVGRKAIVVVRATPRIKPMGDAKSLNTMKAKKRFPVCELLSGWRNAKTLKYEESLHYWAERRRNKTLRP